MGSRNEDNLCFLQALVAAMSNVLTASFDDNNQLHQLLKEAIEMQRRADVPAVDDLRINAIKAL